MKISYNWLKQFIKLDWEAVKTGELLTDLGLEVEGIQPFSSIPGGLNGVVVGEVLTCEKHPNADRLKVTTVNIGEDEPLQIVCGAPNVAAGQKVPVATVGTTLYDPEGNPWQIKKGKIRGESSYGMICAEDELGLGKGHDGILVLDSNITPGTPMANVTNVENDTVFEIGLTPNRADAMSHWGVARDLKAGLKQQGKTIELITPSSIEFKVDNRTQRIDVQVDDYDAAPRYCGVSITGVKVGPAPEWIQNRLKAIGIAPINNIVDITNYVLHEVGQPLHAFDASKISGQKIIVKKANAGEKFTTLDGVERTLHQDDLMICDTEKPLCIAGVFGGENSGVTENTTQLFLESAYFNPVTIRKSAKRHALNTDASFRFERGIDPNITKYALKRAAILITQYAGGEVTSDIEDIYPTKIEDHQVFLNFDNATRLIGEALPRETIKSILSSLEIKVNNITETGIGMTIPAYRNDVTREADVIEEILRVYGYNNIKINEKLHASIAKTARVEDHIIQDKIGNQLTAQGYSEMLNNSLSSPKYHKLSSAIKDEQAVEMLNPLSNDLSVLRQSMLFGALEVIAFNKNRKAPNLKFFEFGKTYHKYSDSREEKNHLTLVISGNKNEDTWTENPEKTDFFYLKGVLATMFTKLGLTQYSEKSSKSDLFSEGLAFVGKKQTLVEFGVVDSKISSEFGIDDTVFYADINWDAVLTQIPTEDFKFKSISKYPKVKRDFALLLDNNISFNELKQAALQTEKQLLVDVNLFDVYIGKSLPDGKKSYALSFTLQDKNKTLTDKQIDKIMNKLQSRFERDFSAVLR